MLNKPFGQTLPEDFTDWDELRKDARHAATAIAELHNVHSYFPVQPVRLARIMGAEVYNAQLGNDVWGMLVKRDNGYSIYLDEDQPHNRYRFSCAHELGHYVDRSRRLEDIGDDIDRRTRRTEYTPDQSKRETWANEFAGELLMPEPVLLDLMEQNMSDPAIAKYFGVSLDALMIRKHNLGLLNG